MGVECMQYKYGEFSLEQMDDVKHLLRKKIFFLLLIVDPKTKDKYQDIDVNAAFVDVLNLIGGLNSLLNYPAKFVRISSLLERARTMCESDDFDFSQYRKVVLDAGNTVEEVM